MKRSILILAFLYLFFGFSFAVGYEYSRARVTARVLDENARPVSDAKVRFVFCSVDNASAIVPVEGLTDHEGQFSGEGYCNGAFGTTIEKEGFYRSGLGVPRLYDIKDQHWLPWDPVVTAVLRPIGNPIPMYVKTTLVEIPEIGVPCGYDLSEGDWVAPYGNGHTADFLITLQRRDEDKATTEAEVLVAFTKPDDGIQKAALPRAYLSSDFKWPRMAPENGYQSSLKTTLRRDTKNGVRENSNPSDTYFFRVRTIKENGRITGALYGKINGGLMLDPQRTKTCRVSLGYYMNSTQLDQNVEWDRKHNLLKNVSAQETPGEP